MAQQQLVKEERSLGDLFSELAGETGTLIRQEIALAQTELTHKAAGVGKDVGYLAIGGAVGYAALLAILAAVIIGLANFIPLWLSALLVGTAVGAVAFMMISAALESLKKRNLTPTQTVDSIKEDAQWLKKQMT